MPRFEFHNRDEPVTATDLQELSSVIGNAAYQTIETDEERARYHANEQTWNESEDGLKEWIEKARSLPLSILLNELAILIDDEALERGAEIRTLSD